jgi:hypothetical protein
MVHVSQVEYAGWRNCWKVTNNEVELIVTGDVGPRIIRYGFAGEQNLLKNFPEQMGTAGESLWMIRGGSRIWISPEDRAASYAPDNEAVRIEVLGGLLTATAPMEESTRLEKQMVVRMAESGSRVRILHRIRNLGTLPVEFSVWVLTVMAPGGTGITGFPPRGTHPEDLTPTNPLVMWAFTDLADPRWRFTRKYLMLRHDAAAQSPQKIGLHNPRTWGAYALNGELFVKRATAASVRDHPDLGCSFEMFTNSEMLELETLGPLRKVLPGEWAEHTETWSLTRGIEPTEWTDEELDRLVAPLI